ncbi:ACT domain-containing protein [Burkholderia sp. A1]|uniref:ACT domain-containing protein n=1 Tax=Burkholderia sp. A1 TaxID=148446 RepID=UPI0004694F93|nr:ACT domain-containing protein [Burkholderia sp. A1]
MNRAPEGQTDLQRLLSGIDPLLDEVIYTFCTVPCDTPGTPAGCICSFDEREGRTLILPLEKARECGLQAAGEWARITLQIHSSLEAVGFIATVATALAREGISANVMSGYYHDHVFVQWARRHEAIDAIRCLALDAGPANAT